MTKPFASSTCYEDAFCPVFRFRYTSGELQLEVDLNTSRDWEPMSLAAISGRVAG